VSGTIQLTANVTNNIYRTWDETKALIAGQELCAVRLLSMPVQFSPLVPK
jgi:hypothetical protein